MLLPLGAKALPQTYSVIGSYEKVRVKWASREGEGLQQGDRMGGGEEGLGEEEAELGTK